MSNRAPAPLRLIALVVAVATTASACGAHSSSPTVVAATRAPEQAAVVPAASPVTTSTSVDTSVVTTTTTTSAPPTTTTTTTAPPTTTTTTTTSTTTTTTVPVRTACRSVAHISDSTGMLLWDAQYLGGDASATLDARYRAVGVEQIIHDDNGGRSIVERIADWQTNALEVALAFRESGFEGCWVLMIGTNDGPKVAAGIYPGAEERIRLILDVIGNEPLLWVDTVTQGAEGFYRNESMVAFGAVLRELSAEHPNFIVMPWSEIVQPEWFKSDGIHYTIEGRVERAAQTALALVEAFPER